MGNLTAHKNTPHTTRLTNYTDTGLFNLKLFAHNFQQKGYVLVMSRHVKANVTHFKKQVTLLFSDTCLITFSYGFRTVRTVLVHNRNN